MAYTEYDIKHYVLKFTAPTGDYTVTSRGGVIDAKGRCCAPNATINGGDGFEMPGDYWPVKAHGTEAVRLGEMVRNVLQKATAAFVEAANAEYFAPWEG